MASDLYLTRIDELTRSDHSYLTATDECWFLREYTAGAGYAHSATNDLISNFKKPVAKKGGPEWKYKTLAIQQIAGELDRVLDARFVASVTFVPMPPSKARADPEHDDRLLQVLRLIAGGRADVRELLVATASRAASYTTTDRRDPVALAQNMKVDPRCLASRPSRIAIVDDVVTTGAHYRAAATVIAQALPGVPVLGLFVARRVIPETAPGA